MFDLCLWFLAGEWCMQRWQRCMMVLLGLCTYIDRIYISCAVSITLCIDDIPRIWDNSLVAQGVEDCFVRVIKWYWSIGSSAGMERLCCLMMFLLIAIDSKMNQGRLIPISIIFIVYLSYSTGTWVRSILLALIMIYIIDWKEEASISLWRMAEEKVENV